MPLKGNSLAFDPCRAYRMPNRSLVVFPAPPLLRRSPRGPRWSWVALTLLALVLPARASSLDDVRKRGVLAIGTDATYPPFEFLVNGQFQGFDIDLGNAIAQELGVKAR